MCMLYLRITRNRLYSVVGKLHEQEFYIVVYIILAWCNILEYVKLALMPRNFVVV